MMGPFGKLPVELIVAIVDAMLALPVNVGRDLRAIATECAEAVRSFATACKVTRAVLTPTHIREARARLRFRVVPPQPLLQIKPHPYTTLLDMSVNSEIVKRAVQTVTREAVLHCASAGPAACCSVIRNEWNARYVSLSDSARGWLGRTRGIAYDNPGSLESVALGEVMNRRARAQINIVDALGTLRGLTPCGSPLVDTWTRQEVVQFGTAPAEEYTPGQEFQPVLRVPYEGVCKFATAHPSGAITVVTEDEPPVDTDHYDLKYTMTTWSPGGAKKLMQHTFHSMDIAAHLILGPLNETQLKTTQGTVTCMWSQGECAWLLFETEIVAWMGSSKNAPFVACFDYRCEAGANSYGLDGRGIELGETHQLLGFCSRWNHGDAAFITQEYSTTPMWILSHFDATRVEVTHGIDEFAEDVWSEDADAQKNRLAIDDACLSRDGLYLIASGRKGDHLWLKIYQRVSDGKWEPLKIGESNALMNSNVPYEGYTVVGPVLSPCGTKVMFFHKSHSPLLCTCNVLDLKETLYWQKWCNQYWYVWHESVPKDCYWGDGLFVQARGGGVLRLGLVEEQ